MKKLFSKLALKFGFESSKDFLYYVLLLFCELLLVVSLILKIVYK